MSANHSEEETQEMAITSYGYIIEIIADMEIHIDVKNIVSDRLE